MKFFKNKAKELSAQQQAVRETSYIMMRCPGVHGRGCKEPHGSGLAVRLSEFRTLESFLVAISAMGRLGVVGRMLDPQGGAVGPDSWEALCPLCGLESIANMRQAARDYSQDSVTSPEVFEALDRQEARLRRYLEAK